MAPKKSLKSLAKKGVTAKKAAAVKGGAPKQPTTVLQGLSTRNHNQVVRKLKPLTKGVNAKQAATVKGGAPKPKGSIYTRNHNQVIRSR